MLIVLLSGCFLLTDVQNGASADMTRLQMARHAQKLEIHTLRSGNPPATWDVLQLDEVPRDGWDQPLVLTVPGPEGLPYEITSSGADGKPGGTGWDADLLWSVENADDEAL